MDPLTTDPTIGGGIKSAPGNTRKIGNQRQCDRPSPPYSGGDAPACVAIVTSKNDDKMQDNSPKKDDKMQDNSPKKDDKMQDNSPKVSWGVPKTKMSGRNGETLSDGFHKNESNTKADTPHYSNGTDRCDHKMGCRGELIGNRAARVVAVRPCPSMWYTVMLLCISVLVSYYGNALNNCVMSALMHNDTTEGVCTFTGDIGSCTEPAVHQGHRETIGGGFTSAPGWTREFGSQRPSQQYPEFQVNAQLASKYDYEMSFKPPKVSWKYSKKKKSVRKGNTLSDGFYKTENRHTLPYYRNGTYDNTVRLLPPPSEGVCTFTGNIGTCTEPDVYPGQRVGAFLSDASTAIGFHSSAVLLVLFFAMLVLCRLAVMF
eukprot:GHVQ01038152.1.p1 GENE.GHVQ01038152.1~~GHVQ01038152.1.p1  ORF type:complete len:372 (+),score=25.96 GHVQ01038152.1:139-1254(+)